MAKTYSTTWHKTVNAVSADEFPLMLVQIDHDDLASPIRIVNDTEDVTHLGNLYQKMAFTITLPDDPEQGIPQATFTMDNVGRELMIWLEAADWSKPTTATLTQILRSDPDVAEFTITMNMSDITATQTTVQAKLHFENFLGVPAVPFVYSPANAPGLY